MSSQTKQPSFWCVASLGDVDPVAYGGAFVLVDMRGIYPTEMIILSPTKKDSFGDPIACNRTTVVCYPLTAIKDGRGDFVALSDNSFHTEYPVWWGTKERLQDLSHYCGESVNQLVQNFLSEDPLTLATAYMGVYNYNWTEQYDCTSMTKKEAENFCRAMKRQEKAAKEWHDGYLLDEVTGDRPDNDGRKRCY
jgi:hypothetical protein